MRIKVMILVLLILVIISFASCSDNKSTSVDIQTPQSSLITPQPDIKDETLRPPKPPSI